MGFSEHQEDKNALTPKGISRRMIESVVYGIRILDNANKGVSLNDIVKYIRCKIQEAGRSAKYNIESLIATSLERAVTENQLKIFGGRYFINNGNDEMDFDIDYPRGQDYPQDGYIYDPNYPLSDSHDYDPPEDRRRGGGHRGKGCGGRRRRKKSSKVKICYYRRYHNRRCPKKKKSRRRKRC